MNTGHRRPRSAVRVILVDFKKDFVLIDHRIILGKVRELAIPREIFLYDVDFLTDRLERGKLLITAILNGLAFPQRSTRNEIGLLVLPANDK